MIKRIPDREAIAAMTDGYIPSPYVLEEGEKICVQRLVGFFQP